MRSLAYLGLALAASLTTALPALAQDETSGTEQTTEPTDPAAKLLIKSVKRRSEHPSALP